VGRLVKEAKARAVSRLASSANSPEGNNNDNVARNEENGTTKSEHGVASLLDGHSGMSLEEIDQNAAGSEKVHQEGL
jgi:hypothetical protein